MTSTVPLIREVDLPAEVVNEYVRTMRGKSSGDGSADAEGIIASSDQSHFVLQSRIDHGVFQAFDVLRKRDGPPRDLAQPLPVPA